MTESEKEEVMQALRGDLSGTPGLMQNMLRVMNDIYTPPDGLLHRMRRSEEMHMKNTERATGAMIVMRLMWGFLSFAVGVTLTLILRK